MVFSNFRYLFNVIAEDVSGVESQSSAPYVYYIYIELSCTQSPFFQNLPQGCTKCKQRNRILVICANCPRIASTLSQQYLKSFLGLRGQYAQITKIQFVCLHLVHSRYTCMAGFARRDIKYMQALCTYNIYIGCYWSVHCTRPLKSSPQSSIKVGDYNSTK